MKLYDVWSNEVEKAQEKGQGSAYIKAYYEKEKEAYAGLLGANDPKVSGTVAEIAAKFGMEPFEAVTFIDGANTSFEQPLEQAALEAIEETTAVDLTLNWEKLYYNMHKAKADWLFNLPQWDGILSEEKRAEITRQYRLDGQAVSKKIDRNAPCPCGSGKKYKKCCGRNLD